MNNEILNQIKMAYEEQCRYLQDKYGLPERNYFANEACKSKVKTNSRSAEGLFLHHNAEILNNSGNLGQPQLAKMYPFEYQLRENLTYCNYIEHLLLHLKMNVRSQSEFEYPFEIKYFFNSLGFLWIANDVNALYKDNGSAEPWRQNCYEVIKDNYNDYVSILKGTLCFIDRNYTGEREIPIEKGAKIVFGMIMSSKDDSEDIKRERGVKTVVEVDPSEDVAIVRYSNGKEQPQRLSKLKKENNVEFYKKMARYNMCAYDRKNIWTDLEEKLKEPYTEEDEMVAAYLKDGIR